MLDPKRNEEKGERGEGPAGADGPTKRGGLERFLSPGLIPPLLALLVYAPVLSHGLLWDDPVILERQLPALTPASAFAPPPGIDQWAYRYYRPLSTVSLLIDRALYGTEPLGYHVTVWLLHGAAAYAVYRLGRRLLRPGSALPAASLFAVYPLAAECVGWIAGRTDVLMVLFCALSATWYLRGLHVREGRFEEAAASRGEPIGVAPWMSRRQHAAGDGRSGRTALLVAAVLCLCGLLSKESAIALPPFLLACACLAGRRWRPSIPSVLAAVLPVAAYLGMRALLNTGVRAEPPAGGSLPAATALLAAGAYFPIHLVVPFFGSSYRPAPPVESVAVLASVGLVLAGALVAVLAFRRRRHDLSLPLLWIGLTIAVSAAAAAWNITRTPVADRYFYAPAVGWCLLLGAWLVTGLERSNGARRAALESLENGARGPRSHATMGKSGARRRAARRSRAAAPSAEAPAAAPASPGHGREPESEEGSAMPRPEETRPKQGHMAPPTLAPPGRHVLSMAAGCALVVLFAWGSLARIPVYADDRAYWEAAVTAAPGSAAAHSNLGNALALGGDTEGALRSYRTALALPLSEPDRAAALTNLGSLLYQLGRVEEAEPVLRSAASVPGAGPTVAFNLGAFLYQKGASLARSGDEEAAGRTFEEARGYLENAVRQDSVHVRAWMLLGHCYASAGRNDLARDAWERILKIEGPEGYIGKEAAMALSRLP